jgi:methylmalonyl-CoA/ethylmalonyl-CoA epimerase
MIDQRFGLSRIGQIALPVSDVPRATAFYRDTLGMKFLFEVPGRMAFFDCAGVRLMLSVPEPGFEKAASILYYAVDDIGTAHRTLVERGVTFIEPPHKVADLGTHELFIGFFRDPEGNPLAIMSEVAK